MITALGTWVILFALSMLPLPSIAQADGLDSPAPGLDATVRAFLVQQTAALGDDVEIQVRDGNANFGPCASPQPFLPRPGTPQGRVTVGIRCGAEDEQTRYVQATVSAQVRHLVASRTIGPGERLDQAALSWETSDLSHLRRGYLSSLTEAVGQVAKRRIPAGTSVTDDMIRKPWMVKRGDTVMLTATGEGFRISRSVEALENGGLGSTIRLKTENRQILQGKVTGQDQLSVDF
ncbi:flagellar basal body P-ring formation chaperone FlgA [Salinicola rhizosphaerae]|uniref:Flagella basal body P-ring formation protein FlgA n=1 Tax=Salinicola rhizosphaerae TaxID=1443141 RepID=A0ABQ3DRR8_9GAMM|nr:flagellar basal body P-ring formation chaperone FlgA [Salinicola rhizosphaerae]GHB08530.1 flagella basal body P-ring formation protein FlgA [Salinicola rhizosphaerae]